jgi:hypothetical protein
MATVRIVSLLFQSSFLHGKLSKFFLVIFIFPSGFNCQIANYVTNGSFEEYYSCSSPKGIYLAKGWRTIDSSLLTPVIFHSVCYPNVPVDGSNYQWPRTGNNFGGASFLCEPPACSPSGNRGYFRNRLKGNLLSGKLYCVKFYANARNISTYGIDSFGAYFSDNSIDTITKTEVPLTYLNPQISNPTGTYLTDTLGWTTIAGTFMASGSEKFLVIGNFKSDANTNKILINPTNLPTVGCDVLIDDVSCIPLDLPAYAAPGPDIWAIPGTTTYIGRPQDVGIDEACEWFKLPNTTSVIANVAGLTLTVAAGTETYMVKQDICGVIKYDTVVIHASGVGNVEWSAAELSEKLKVFPNPADEVINVECSVLNDGPLVIKIFNNLGQMLRQEEIRFENRKGSFKVNDLLPGIYMLSFSTTENYSVNKRVVVSH